jgi:hypothetical protein
MEGGELMKKIEIEEISNGYIIKVNGAFRNGTYGMKYTEEFDLLKLVGKTLCDCEIKVERK